jgi:hypothetical protein
MRKKKKEDDEAVAGAAPSQRRRLAFLQERGSAQSDRQRKVTGPVLTIDAVYSPSALERRRIAAQRASKTRTSPLARVHKGLMCVV